MAFFPEISASKVAGFIGLHKYQDINDVFYDILVKDKELKSKIHQIETTYKRRAFNQVLNEVLRDPNVMDCISLGMKEVQNTANVTDVLDDVQARAKVILDLRKDMYSDEVRARLAEEIRGKISQRRGLLNEDAILNNYETERDVKVVERNTKMLKKRYETFGLIGRIDGYVASEKRIVDSKERTKFWPTVPLYDEIQLRCYMDMAGAKESELLERFPDGTTRTTKFVNDPEKWNALYGLIEKSAAKLRTIAEDPEELKRVVFARTISVE